VDYSDEIIVGAVHRVTGRIGALAQRPVLCDSVIAFVLAIVSFIGLADQRRLGHTDTIVFCFLLVAPLPLRAVDRRLSFLLVAAVAVVQWLTSTPQIADGSVLFALFWVTLDGRPLEVLIAAAIVEVGAIMAALRWTPDQPGKPWVAITGLGVAAGAIGLAIRERRQLVASLQERAARLELERDQEGRLGALAERSRIAREMHDIVSHNLTVMIGLADGAGYALEGSPDDARSAIQRLSATGRQALGEMRRLLGVLHEEPGGGSYEPQPGLDRLDDLLERVEAAGIPVSLEVYGDPQALSAGMQLTLFRVAQEALTNTLKHAGRPATAHLSLSSSSGLVVLEVTDTGGALAQEAKLPSAGRGLAGMRERAAAFAGELEAGPLPEGGWRVRLTLAADTRAVAS
jgi:signal transduction histidine kinase